VRPGLAAEFAGAGQLQAHERERHVSGVQESSRNAWRVLLLPGGILPAEPAFHDLLSVLDGSVDAVAKDLEVYAGDAPPVGFSLSTEVEGVRRAADAAGFDRFHLVGYSAGGASALAFAAAHPDRLHSLALFEPAWAGNEGLSREEAELWGRFTALVGLPPREFMLGFTRYQLAPGVEPPPQPGPPPPWMVTRPAGLTAFLRTFDTGALDLAVLRRFARPVYFGLGGRSNPDYYARMAERLRAVFPDFTLEVHEERHHFDPPHRTEPERVAASLRALWTRAEA
jgi:pimeloyl-ACP methyl ester carboxylesterase